MKATATDAEIIAAAREQWADDDLEIDDHPRTSRVGQSDDVGAWVQAWVWVRFDEEAEDDDGTSD